MTRLLVIDTETSGLDPVVNGVLALGAVVWEEGRIINELQVFINDTDCAVDPESMAINKIDLKWLSAYGSPPAGAVEALEEFVNANGLREERSGKVKLAGHNLTFDIPFLKRLYRQAGRSYGLSFSHRAIDTASVLGFLSVAGILPTGTESSSAAFEYFGINVPDRGRHTALGDARATAMLLDSLIGIVRGLQNGGGILENRRISLG